VLVDTKRFYHSKGRTSVNSFADVGFEAFGPVGSALVNIAIIANQVGVISAYQQFIGKTIRAADPAVLGQISLPGWVMIWCAVLIPLCCVRQLRYFSLTSLMGLVCMFFTVVAVTVNGALDPTPPDPLPIWPSDLFLFLGVAAFGYAGIAISISVENAMRKPDDFLKMITGTFCVVSTIYIAFGIANFILYGNNAQVRERRGMIMIIFFSNF
jgi:amino acid permease